MDSLALTCHTFRWATLSSFFGRFESLWLKLLWSDLDHVIKSTVSAFYKTPHTAHQCIPLNSNKNMFFDNNWRTFIHKIWLTCTNRRANQRNFEKRWASIPYYQSAMLALVQELCSVPNTSSSISTKYKTALKSSITSKSLSFLLNNWCFCLYQNSIHNRNGNWCRFYVIILTRAVRCDRFNRHA